MDYHQLILTPISNENGCGESLEDESDFQNFFFVAQGTPERYDGENTLPAEPPNWRDIKKQALVYLEKTKDIKLISVLAQAVLNTEGVIKFSECMQGLAELIDTQWETVYPPLDEDDGDPLERVSALTHLNEGFIYQTLKTAAIASARGIGLISLAYLDSAGASSEQEQLSDSQIEGIFQENNSEELQLFYNALRYSHKSLTSMSESFTKNAGHEYALDFGNTLSTLEKMSSVIEQFAQLPENQVTTEQAEPNTDAETQHVDTPMPQVSTTQAADIAVIKSRDDVERCLRAIIEYYGKHESTSPLPILINRALNLVHKDFLGVMKDIYPDALPVLYDLGGIKEESNDEDSEGDSNDGW